MQSADVYTCIAANLQPTEQWVLRQVCAAWRHHFRKQPPQLCLVITRRWTLKACPTSLLPQVWRLEFNRTKVNQRVLDLIGSCGCLQHLVFNQCVLSAGRLPALPQLTGLVIHPASARRSAMGQVLLDCVRTAPASLQQLALSSGAEPVTLDELGPAMSHLTALTCLQLANIRARNVPDAEHAIMRTSLQKLTLSSLDTTNQACHGRTQVLQQLCSPSVRAGLTSLAMACRAVSPATLMPALALPRLRCLMLNTDAVHVLYSQDAPLASMLASPGELQALSLACELSSNLDALLSGLSGLEQLMLPAIDADTACGGLGCLSTLTRLTGTHSGVLSTLRKLKWLDIRSTVVEDLASAAIASLPSLESLNTRGVLFGPDAALAVARGCPALRAWDIRCCQLTRRQMAALMAARPHVALMSSGKPAFIADERAFAVFEGDEVTPSRMNLRQHLDALVNEHFGVREDWPPLSQPTVSAIVRGYSDGWGARMMADADASSLTSAEFWVEMLWFAAYVIVGGCNTADRAQYARPPHNDPSMVTRSQAGSSTAGSVMMHLHVALHALSSCTSSATLIVRIWIYICACLIICLLTLLVLVARTLRSGWDALLQ